MLNQLTKRNFYLLMAADIAVFAVSLVLSYFVRYTFDIPLAEFRRIIEILPWVIAVKCLTFIALSVYRGMWRYTSLPDAINLAKACFLASLIIITGITVFNRFEGYPRSVFIADSIFTLFFCGGIRLGIRFYYSGKRARSGNTDEKPINRIRVVLIGAGDAADKIIREVQGNPWSTYQIACCLDDDTTKQHRSLLDIPIRGPVSRLSHYAQAFKASEVLIAMPSISGDRMRKIVKICEKSELPFKTLPSLTSLIDGNVTLNDLRPVNFEDLLGRPPVKLDLAEIGHYLTGKTVAVTGAGGSIGSELCRQIIRFKPASLVLIDSSEFNLYRIEMELKTERHFGSIHPVMGRIQDFQLMNRIFAHFKPHTVFHAAAYKHVPLVELNPWEAVFNNVVGSRTLMEVAEAHGSERCVFISTDKAVRPTNVMGASKRAVEMLLQSRPQGKTRFMAVRFGNVVGSSGSAIPLFQSQIKAGGPVTVTDPEMTRYFMTIPEAAQLVLQAGSLGEGGEIFVLEMGTPVKIADMARDLIRLSGKEPDRDIMIIFTGLRPGEKLYEELITQGEGIMPTSHEKIMVLRRSGPFNEEYNATLSALLAELIRATNTLDVRSIKESFKRFVPEYTPCHADSVLCRH